MSQPPSPVHAHDLGAQIEKITYDGSNGSDVTLFLQNVKRIAFIQGRQHDDQWLIDCAEISLVGEALRWFHELDDETVSSWKALRGAFLRRLTTTPRPTAPAAAPLAAAPIHKFVTRSLPRALPPPEVVVDQDKKSRKSLLIGDSGLTWSY
ncbi:hypothetical protein FRB93_011773 [Tulasnella sp. JGI-2019a]|nr:hypothetical protein FRB93_011773 [Tulasnella sp. JGI-2019a]